MLGEHDENITPIEDHHLYQKAVTVPPTTMAPNKINSIHWFRKGLRLHDNPSLLEAASGADTLRCVYFLDPWFAGASNLGVNRWRFLLQCLEDLDTSLRKLNSRLFVIRGQPANIFPRLFKQWNVTRLTFESDSEPFGKDRDAAIKKLAAEAGVDVITRTSHTLYDLDKIIELNEGQPPVTFKRFQTLVSSMPPPDLPVEPLTRATMGTCVTPVTEECRRKYSVPHLEELGFDTEGLGDAVWPGGETEALARIELGPDVSTAWQMNFERPKLSSNPLLPSNLGLSPYLRFGCLSCRLFYSKLAELYKKVKPNGSLPASLCDKLLWRDFFYAASTNNPRFDRMDGNPICISIPWDRNPEALAKWAEACTGFPWIDAIMTQLRQEGWIHHLARHAVACFLTRGDLWISWEEGMKVFEELLLDADWSVNAGSWMSHSCSSFFQQFFHCYCPVGTGRRIDPNGDYIRRYLPVLRNFPDKYIHDPWNAPEEVQRDAHCIVGEDYPKPMVNHAEASRLNIERMRQIYQQLSRDRGLSLLPSGPIEDLNVNRCCYSTTKRPCGANVHQGRSENQSGQMRSQRETTNQEACQTGIGQKFAVPQNPGALTRGGGHSSLKRQRESEHDVKRDTDSFSAYKVQRQSKQKEVGGQEQLMAVSS